MQTKICQSVGEGIARYVGRTYNYSLSAFEKLTAKAKREEILNISRSVSMAAGLQGRITIFYCLTPISSISKGRGVLIEILIQEEFLSPENLKVMDRCVDHIRSYVKGRKHFIWGAYTMETSEVLAKPPLATVANTSLNPKTTASQRMMTVFGNSWSALRAWGRRTSKTQKT